MRSVRQSASEAAEARRRTPAVARSCLLRGADFYRVRGCVSRAASMGAGDLLPIRRQSSGRRLRAFQEDGKNDQSAIPESDPLRKSHPLFRGSGYLLFGRGHVGRGHAGC